MPTAPEAVRNRDPYYPYRPDSYFYYLTGFAEPEAVMALVANGDGDRHILFCRPKNEEREIWTAFATARTPRARSSASTRRI